MSSDTKSIYEEHIKPLSRDKRLLLLKLLQVEFNNCDDNSQGLSILELHGLGREIWQDVDPKDYVRELRKEWDDRVR